MSDRSASAQLERQIRTRTKARLRQAKAEGRLFEADIGPQTAVASTKVARKVERTVEPDPQGAVARVRGDREATRVVPLRDRGAPRQHDPEAILAAIADPKLRKRDGTANLSAIAREFGCSPRTVRNIRDKDGNNRSI
jgi:hypothetical protein